MKVLHAFLECDVVLHLLYAVVTMKMNMEINFLDFKTRAEKEFTANFKIYTL